MSERNKTLPLLFNSRRHLHANLCIYPELKNFDEQKVTVTFTRGPPPLLALWERLQGETCRIGSMQNNRNIRKIKWNILWKFPLDEFIIKDNYCFYLMTFLFRT